MNNLVKKYSYKKFHKCIHICWGTYYSQLTFSIYLQGHVSFFYAVALSLVPWIHVLYA